MSIEVNVGKFPGSVQTLALNDDSTVADALRIAAVDSSGYDIRLNGVAVDTSAQLSNQDSVILTRKIKGNQNPIIVRVGRVPGRIEALTLNDRATLREAIDASGFRFDECSDSVSLSGTSGCSLDSTLSDGDTVLITAKVKGN